MLRSMMARQIPRISGLASGWPRRLALLLAVVLAIFPALSLAAAAHGYAFGPADSPAGHAHMHGAPEHAGGSGPHHQSQPMQQHADIAAAAPSGNASDHHATYDGNCCDACQIAVGLLAAAVDPTVSPHGVRVARRSDVTPPGQPASAPAEPPRS